MTHRKPGYIAGVVMGLFLLPGCATLATETGSLEAVPAVAQTTDAAPPSTIDPSPTAVLAADIGSDAATDTDTPTTVVVGKHSAQEVADMLVIEEVTPFPDADPAKTSGSGDIWDRVRKGFALPDQYDNHPLVVNHLQWHLCRPDFLQRVTARA
ncbi:MAG: hypothetical protein PHQ14_06265, partial [Chromatiales bacterium]|nr:hypothetical protein [Chromatiales bacterium]